MAALKSSSLLLKPLVPSSSSSSPSRRAIINAMINIPRRSNISLPSIQTQRNVSEELHSLKRTEKQFSPNTFRRNPPLSPNSLVIHKLYAILEAVSDRIEMHKNIGEQRANWNSLLLNSVNALTLAATTMTAIAAVSGGPTAPIVALKLSSTSLYVAVTGMLAIMNTIQPSQLAEEQRNAVRLFKQLRNQIHTLISIGNPTAVDVKDMMDRVLAIDRAYPLPLLGVMLEKFPAKVEPTVWWPEQRRRKQSDKSSGFNGWNRKLEEEMKSIANVIRIKDTEDYLKLGEKALKLNKFFALAAPTLTGLAAVGSAFVNSPTHGGLAVMLGVMGGALASVVNSLEHGGQIGMVFEMYKSNAGFFKLMEETIGENLSEYEPERRENGELFELKVGLQLGRSLSQLRDFAGVAAVKGEEIDEFASKLF